MTESFFAVSHMALSGLRALFAFLLIRRLMDGREKSARAGECAAAFGGGAVLAVCFALAGGSEYYGLAAEAVLAGVLASRTGKTDLRMCLFISSFYEIGLALWSFLAGALPAVLTGSRIFLERKSFPGQAALWSFYVIFSLLALRLLRKGKQREGQKEPEEEKQTQEKRGLRLVSLIVIAGFLAVVTLSEQKRIAFSADELYLWLMMSLILMVGVLVFSMRKQYEMEKELLRLQTEQRELLERDYRSLNQSYELNARLFHDFHHHIGVLQRLLSDGENREALEYLEGIQEPVRNMAERTWTGDRAVDYLINSRAAAAEEKKIRFHAEAEFPRHTDLRSEDLTAVLGNLLDNALEAADKVQGPENRFVSLVIRRVNQMLVIRVENSFSGELKEKNGALKTTKTEEGLHGWGLKSAQAAARKYDGTVRVSEKNGIFRATATMSFAGRR